VHKLRWRSWRHACSNITISSNTRNNFICSVIKLNKGIPKRTPVTHVYMVKQKLETILTTWQWVTTVYSRLNSKYQLFTVRNLLAKWSRWAFQASIHGVFFCLSRTAIHEETARDWWQFFYDFTVVTFLILMTRLYFSSRASKMWKWLQTSDVINK